MPPGRDSFRRNRVAPWEVFYHFRALHRYAWRYAEAVERSGQRPETRDQRPETRDQRPEIRNPDWSGATGFRWDRETAGLTDLHRGHTPKPPIHNCLTGHRDSALWLTGRPGASRMKPWEARGQNGPKGLCPTNQTLWNRPWCARSGTTWSGCSATRTNCTMR